MNTLFKENKKIKKILEEIDALVKRYKELNKNPGEIVLYPEQYQLLMDFLIDKKVKEMHRHGIRITSTSFRGGE